MAEPIGIAAGVLGLTTFAVQSSKVLYQSLEGLKKQARNIRDLKDELQALAGVLESLKATISDPEVDLTVLEIPLLQCGQACNEFACIVDKCASRSERERPSFRDWIQLTYREKDINGFRNLIAAYKSTIAIALADTNM